MKHVHAVLQGRKAAEVADSGRWLQSNEGDMKTLLAEDEDLRTFLKWKRQGDKPPLSDCKGRRETLRKLWQRWEWTELLDGVPLYKMDPGSHTVQRHSITAPRGVQREVFHHLHTRRMETYQFGRDSLQRAATWQKRNYDKTATERKFEKGDWVLRLCPPNLTGRAERQVCGDIPGARKDWRSQLQNPVRAEG